MSVSPRHPAHGHLRRSVSSGINASPPVAHRMARSLPIACTSKGRIPAVYAGCPVRSNLPRPGGAIRSEGHLRNAPFAALECWASQRERHTRHHPFATVDAMKVALLWGRPECRAPAPHFTSHPCPGFDSIRDSDKVRVNETRRPRLRQRACARLAPDWRDEESP